MHNITTCVVINKANETDVEELKVCTKWTDKEIKILVGRSDDSWLTGQILLEDFKEYSIYFEKSLEIYLEETRNILSGHNQEIEFNLKNNELYWKKKHCLLGKVKVYPTITIQNIGEFLSIFIVNHSKDQKDLTESKKDHENLKNLYSELCNKLNKFITLKEDSEKDMYKKVFLLLNSKKAKIRYLKNEIKILKNKTDDIFDASTDESDNDDNFTSDPDILNKSINKRLLEESIYKSPEKRKKVKDINNDEETNIRNVNENSFTKINGIEWVSINVEKTEKNVDVNTNQENKTRENKDKLQNYNQYDDKKEIENCKTVEKSTSIDEMNGKNNSIQHIMNIEDIKKNMNITRHSQLETFETENIREKLRNSFQNKEKNKIENVEDLDKKKGKNEIINENYSNKNTVQQKSINVEEIEIYKNINVNKKNKTEVFKMIEEKEKLINNDQFEKLEDKYFQKNMEEIEPIPSTSRCFNILHEIGEDEETPDIFSDESEFELKFDEEHCEDHDVNALAESEEIDF